MRAHVAIYMALVVTLGQFTHVTWADKDNNNKDDNNNNNNNNNKGDNKDDKNSGIISLFGNNNDNFGNTNGKKVSTATSRVIYKYLGCYVDTDTRDLSGLKLEFPKNLTVDMCTKICSDRKFKYAGVQAGRQCFCGNSYGRFGKKKDSECSVNCPGNANQKCGANWRQNAYQVAEGDDSNALPYGATYVGCYNDNKTRDLSEFSAQLGSATTLENCIELGYKNYMQYVGLQNGVQCFGSSASFGRYGRAAETDCKTKCAGDANEICGASYKNSIYKLATVRANPCSASPAPCKSGSICKPTVEGTAVCSCPAGSVTDGNGGCCKTVTCTCWGDPHCTTFDGGPFNFQGRCKYQHVTTNCAASKLPAGMVPFDVQIKQENRDGVPNAQNVAFVRYVEINVFNTQYRLLKQDKNNVTQFSINGVITPTPWSGNNISVAITGGRLAFSTGFSLTIFWDGKSRAEISLCSVYSKYVCGLCGNLDGVASNDYVDPKNNPVTLKGDKYTMYFGWGSTWRTFDDSIGSKDINNSTCNPANPPGNITGPACKNGALYDGTSWCGAIKDTAGAWATCIKKMDLGTVNSFFDSCSFDVCSFEGNSTQKDQLCGALQKFNEECLGLAQDLNTTWTFNWRTKYGCDVKCSGANQVFELRSECAKTCRYPTGNYQCGDSSPYEACYCAEGYVLDEKNNCVELSSCGCDSPMSVGIMMPGESLYANCTTEYFCNGQTRLVEVRTRPNCSSNGYCQFDANNYPKCYCNATFTGDGYVCTRLIANSAPVITTPAATTTTAAPTTTPATTTATTTTPEPTTTTTEPTTTTTTTPEPTTTTTESTTTATTTPETTTTTTESTTTTPETTTTTPETTTTTPETTTTTPETTTTTPETTTTTTESTTTTPETTTTTESTTTTPETTTTTPETTTTTPETTTTTESTTTTPETTTTTPETTTSTTESTTTTDTTTTSEAIKNPTGFCTSTKKSPKCYIYGDPHYIGLDQTKFSISDDCAYLVASDSCTGNNLYQIFAVHEHRYNATGVSFLGKVIVLFGGRVYELDEKVVKTDGKSSTLPIETSNLKVSIDQKNVITFQTAYFTLSFDDVQFFEFSKCETDTLCGLCGVQESGKSIGHSDNIGEYLVNDSKKNYCASKNAYAIPTFEEPVPIDEPIVIAPEAPVEK